MSHASSIPTEWSEVGGTTDTLLGPSGHFISAPGLHCVWIVARHHKQRQSWSRSTEPHVLSHWIHFADTGRFPSIHWCGMIKLPSKSSIISFPTLANVVHLQFDIAFAAQRLCTLNLQTSQESPWEVTPDKASRHTYRKFDTVSIKGQYLRFKLILIKLTLQYVGRAWLVAYQWWWPDKKSCWSGGAGSKKSLAAAAFIAWHQSSISLRFSAPKTRERVGVMIWWENTKKL